MNMNDIEKLKKLSKFGKCKITDITVYESNDYSIFKRLKGNRDLTSMKKIMDSINEIGYINNPIMVNENLEIIDGQNRFETLKQLEMPIQFFIVEHADIKTARKLNLGRTNWKPIDYVKSYAEEGNLSYQFILKLMDEYSKYGFGLQEIYSIAKNNLRSGGLAQSDLNYGTFKFSEEEYISARDVLEKLNSIDIIEISKRMQGSRRALISAVAWALRIEDCDSERLLSKIQMNYPLFRPIVNPYCVLEDISQIYNKGLAKDKKIYFELLHRKETA